MHYDKAEKAEDGWIDYIDLGSESYSEALEKVKNSPVSKKFSLWLSSFFNFSLKI